MTKSFILAARTSLLALAVIVSGCFGGSNQTAGDSGGEASEDESGTVINNTPEDELFFYTAQNKIYEEEENFEKLIGQYIRKKFPDIKIKHIHWNDGTRYEDLIAKGTIPDIVLEDVRRNTTRLIGRFKLEHDMSDLIKKYNFDSSVLSPAAMQAVANASNGGTYSLPFEINDYVLVYNKDIFDKFGEDYPESGMTYDEAYELAKKLSRQDGDITYKGYQQHPSHYMQFNQLSAPALHPEEDRAYITTDTWMKLVNNIRRFYDIKGNQFTSTTYFPQGKMAMSVDVVENVVKWAREYPDLNFDFAAVPVFPESPGSKYQPNMNGLFITNQSNKKDLAFQVIAYLLSEEVQMERAKQGVVSPMNSEQVVQVFGQNVPELQGKSVQNIFALQHAVPAPRKPGLTFIDPKVAQIFQPLIFEESKDNVTALRIVEEEMNRQIDETKLLKEAGGDWWKWQ
ncbi:ABC transporter substrate-binding protein [Paenibacillus alkalitolerans]|uniref:ABC transporter substrate-binding protein n=1 Tax=Paenibacillus alkalitolerans TaxID=2799335 RepID=UPI0018F4A0C8|nr:extracellular solute-binding protein [Paenibacillus alkalitolerans]